MSDVLQEAMFYGSELGWHVVPLKQNSKLPALGKNWQNRTSNDEEVISEWFTEQYEGCNLGIILGPQSGIIDVECDNEEAEKEFRELFGDIEVATPCYRSKRGMHRIFKWCESLPWNHKAKHEFGHVEFRIGGGKLGAQSVAPPSVVDGVKREWILHPSDTPIMELPEDVVNHLIAESIGVSGQGDFEAKPDDFWSNAMTAQITEGRRNDTAMQIAGKLLRHMNRLSKDMPWGQLQLWNRSCCNPPLDEDELRAVFASCYERESDRRRTEFVEQVRTGDAESDDGPEEEIDGWKLYCIEGDPPVYQLESPAWPDRLLKGLSADDLLNPKTMCLRIMDQLGIYIPVDTFKSQWLGVKTKKEKLPGVLDRIFPRRKTIDAPPELRRDIQVAEAVLDLLSDAREMNTPQSNGMPAKIIDTGEVLFRSKSIYEELASKMSDPPSRSELWNVYNEYEFEDKSARVGGKALRYKVVSSDAMKRMEESINGAFDEILERTVK